MCMCEWVTGEWNSSLPDLTGPSFIILTELMWHQFFHCKNKIQYKKFVRRTRYVRFCHMYSKVEYFFFFFLQYCYRSHCSWLFNKLKLLFLKPFYLELKRSIAIGSFLNWAFGSSCDLLRPPVELSMNRLWPRLADLASTLTWYPFLVPRGGWPISTRLPFVGNHTSQRDNTKLDRM